MKRNLNEMIGSLVIADDGNIGKVVDFCFDDHKWTIRYLVVETGGWHKWNKVLLSPMAFKKFDWESKEFTVNLTKEQVRNSPGIDTDKTVSRLHETELHDYYGWPFYWDMSGSSVFGGLNMGYMPEAFVRTNETDDKVPSYSPEGEPNLRSIKEVTGYNMQINNEEIGSIESFFFNDETWIISYMMVNSSKLMDNKKVLISPYWVSEVSWTDSKIFVDLTLEAIKYCPEFDYLKTISPDYESKLCDYYSNTRK